MSVLKNPVHSPIRPAAEPAAPRFRFALPRDVRRLGRLLLHQQCWCWGQDIRRQGGNLLLEYGFERHGMPEEAQGCTVYRLRLPGRRVLLLWGFGFFFGQTGLGGLIVGRYEFRPRLSPRAHPSMPVWRPEQIPGRLLPQSDADFARALALLAQGMRAISEYESWVAREIGLPYRRRLIVEWDRDYIPAEGVAETWLAMAERCERRLRTLRDGAR